MRRLVALGALGSVAGLRGSVRRPMASRVALSSAAAEDCGCAPSFGGDVPESARALDHLGVVRDLGVFDVATGGATTLGAKVGEGRVCVVAFLRSFG